MRPWFILSYLISITAVFISEGLFYIYWYRECLIPKKPGDDTYESENFYILSGKPKMDVLINAYLFNFNDPIHSKIFIEWISPGLRK
jgi:hypothetical protein